MTRVASNTDVRSVEGGAPTLADFLRTRAVSTPTDVAQVFLADGERDEHVLTYAELDARARRVAVALTAHGAAATPVLLLFDPGLDFSAAIFGCFLAGAIAVPMYPPDLRDMASGFSRIRRVLADCGATVVLTTRTVRARLEGAAGALGDERSFAWCVLDDLPAGSEAAWCPRPLGHADVAFLQYTSGSTGAPKGVVVTHGNLVAHGDRVTSRLGLDATAVVVSWLPVYHDMGLIGAVLLPMQLGCRSILMSPLAFLERPRRWVQAISRHGGTLSPAPNFAYDLVVRKTTPADRSELDLRSWAAAMNGAEPVRAETCERFVAAFAACGFRRGALVPCYGLAEATLMVSGGPCDAGPTTLAVDGAALGAGRLVEARRDLDRARVLTASGRIVAGLEVVVVHPETHRPCADGEVGEIWIAGPTVAAGYWQRPEETAAIFAAHLDDGRGPFLRSGDLGVVRDDVLFVTGRRKDLIVIRGRNYYPQDLEHTANRAHGALRPGGAAAFAVDDGRAERVVVVHEIDTEDLATCNAATVAVRGAIAREHDLHPHAVVLIPARTLPKTSSGKVRRRDCRAALERGELRVLHRWPATAAPGTASAADAEALEAWLVRTIAELRGLSEDRVHGDDALVALGIDSADAAHVAAELETRLGRRVPLRLLMEQPTIATLATALSRESA